MNSDYDKGEGLDNSTQSHEYRMLIDFARNNDEPNYIDTCVQFNTQFKYDDIHEWHEIDVNKLHMIFGGAMLDVSRLFSNKLFYEKIKESCTDYIKAEYGVTIQ